MSIPQTKAALAAALASAGALGVALLAGDAGAPQVSVADVNPGTSVERDLCLTVSLPGGASECGDLRLAHALPSVRTLNQVRTPVLLYNSQHASPHPIVAANVSLPSGTGGLSRVVATLKINGTPRAQGVWRGSAWPAGTGPARIAVGYDAASDPTGPYRYTLEVKACYGTTCVGTTVPGQLAVVNRRESPFGAGWWLAGVERLVMDPFGKPVLWVGGDGSTRRYTAARGDSVWGAPNLDRPDTLKRTGNGWVRLLSGNMRVHFDALGRHVSTTNRLGHSTAFWYNSTGRLDSIGVPPTVTREGSFAYPAPRRLVRPYTLMYDGNGHLARVEAPAIGTGSRSTALYRTGARVDSIVDPDDTRVRFGYDATSSLRVTFRTDRRRYRTDYRYDAGYRLAASKLWMDTLAAGDSIVSTLRAGESVGLASPNGQGAVEIANAYAQVDGPRADADAVDRTRFWLDRWGAPQRIVNPLGDTTHLTRGDPRYPALVTRVRYPNGGVVGARYDARGNVTASTDSSTSRAEPDGTIRFATTLYEWDPRWDAVTKVTLPEREVTTFGYDPVTGNRIWQQVGSDIARRVNFRYQAEGTAQGMIAASTAPGAQQSDSVAYDHLGNLALVVSPKGARIEYQRDELGRDTATLVPLEGTLVQRQTVRYVPGSDLVERTGSFGPPMNGAPAQTLWVRNEYDAAGNVAAVERWSDPELAAPIGRIRTSWRYDAAGRAVAELAPGSGTVTETRYERVCEETPVHSCIDVPYDTTYTVEYRDSTRYDPAGNPVEVHTRRANPATRQPLVIRMRYDALGQLLERTVPQVHYSHPRNQGIPRNFRTASTVHCTGEILERTYPGRPNDGGCGYRIEEDVQTFRYDAMGNVIRADNRDAQVRRQFNRNGTLRIDSLRIRATAAADFSLHQYGLELKYDLNGRRVGLMHPSQLAPSASQASVSYGYDPVTGALSDVTDPLGNVFRYEYDVKGQLHRKVFTDAAYDEYGYDEDGALTAHASFRLLEKVTGENFRRLEYLRHTQLARDAGGRLTRSSNLAGRRDNITSRYSGLGHVVGTTAAIYGDATDTPTFRGTEAFGYDALGNASTGSALQSAKERTGRKETEFNHTSRYSAGTDRLSWTDRAAKHSHTSVSGSVTVSSRDVFQYDSSGNLEFSTQAYRSNGSCDSQSKDNSDCEDRASFYAADGTLRAAEHRVRMGTDNQGYWRATFEEYRYDALGRRVWVRSRMECPGGTAAVGWPLVPCFSKVRRTVWDGDAEPWEIQMPGQDGSAYMENDTQPLPVKEYIAWVPDFRAGPPPAGWDVAKHSRFDPNPHSGRVAYTHGLGVDQPLSLVRIGLNRYYADPYPSSGGQGVTFAPFAAMPLTDWRGHTDGAVYAGGAREQCQTFSGTVRCTDVVASQAWSAYGWEDPSALSWNGTLLTGKRDDTGTLFRRARYYDPQTGRFTQEDPIGLAGGVNLYGYAGGDPVNLSDPSGLCPWCIGGAVAGAFVGGAIYYATTPSGERTFMGFLGYAAGGAAIGGTFGYGMTLGGAGTGSAGIVKVVNAAGKPSTVSASAAAAGAASTPVVSSAVPKLANLAQQFGTTSQDLVARGLNTATKFVDHANNGNINALFARLDGAPGWIRVTFDPTNTRIISAGLMRAKDVARYIAQRRLTPY